MAKDRRSRDQKRRDKLAKKARSARKAESLAYMGEKFKTDELIPTWMQTEIGIYEAYVMTDRKLLDQTVVNALETLIKQLRAGTSSPLSDSAQLHYEIGQEAELVVGMIHRRWAQHFETEWRPARDQRIGVLRTILGSIEKLRTPGPRSQSYLHHIAGFLTKKLGVSVKRVSADMTPLPEPEEDDLVQAGRKWILHENHDARTEFYELAGDRMSDGKAEGVIDACHQLMGEVNDPASEIVAELTQMSNQARRTLVSSMG
jgi:hypothetical protein